MSDDADDPRDIRKPDIRPAKVRAQTARPIPTEIVDEVTGNHQSIEQLQAWRESRSPDERFRSIELKQDASAKVQDDMMKAILALAIVIARWDEKLNTIVAFTSASDAERKRRIEAEEKAALAANVEAGARRAWIVKVITVLGVAIAGIISAYVAGKAGR